MNNLQEQYDCLYKEVEQLRKENAEIKALLQKYGLSYHPSVEGGKGSIVSLHSPVSFPSVSLNAEQRVALFRSLFRGREDVFARRWYSRATGKCGYQPVCINEWRQGVCDKKKYKCAECPNRRFAPLGYHDIYRHLEGKSETACDVVGLYAIMPDNNCAFLCTDFDDKSCNHGYKDDVLAFVGVCKEWNIPYSVERSRSGNGAHVWIFFENVVPAYKARRLGNAILTEAMKHDGRLSFNSYDRFFPNQDVTPEGGFGNLVALPLQGKARKELNSVFVDDDFLAYKDQWAYLYSIKKVREETVDKLVSQHVVDDLSNFATSSEAKPWTMPAPQNISQSDFNEAIDIVKADKIYVPLKSLSAKAVNHLKRIAAFKNPEFYRHQAMRLSTYGIPRVISCADIMDDYIAMPRGCEDAIIKFLNDLHIQYHITDKTNHGHSISVSFLGEEREEQIDAINAMIAHDNGVLHATTAFGKTVTAAAMISRKNVNTLILVHTKALLDQWHERLMQFLNIDYAEPEEPKRRGRKNAFTPVGCLDSTRNTLHGIIDVALIQSCISDGEVKSFLKDYGMVIVDECHHVPSVTFENVLKEVRAQYVYGLTATPIRKDNHQPIIFMQCGPIRFSADAKSQIARQTFKRYLIPRFTSFHSVSEEKGNFTIIKQEIADDAVRNKLIVDDTCKAMANGRTSIILTDLTSHVSTLSEMLMPHCKNVICLTGTGSTKDKKETLQRLLNIPSDEPLVIVATGKYVGEGFDYPRLDTLFLACPLSWKGRLQQYAGRLHREYEGKKDVRIYDYIDIHVPMCDRMYHKRLRGYASIGYLTVSQTAPTLFDSLEDLELTTEESMIYNGKTFYRIYAKELASAKRSVIISSPRLYDIARNAFVPMLKELAANGVSVMIFTKAEDGQKDCLVSLGLSVRVVHDLSLCCTIIDKSSVWYGSINILGFASEEYTVIRMSDNRLADELLNILYSGNG